MGNTPTPEFNKKSTAMEAADGMDLTGKTCLVTGCNSIGLGRETVRVLALHGAKVYMLNRNQKKAETARNELIKSIKTIKKDFNENNLINMSIDLSSLLSIRRCVAAFSKLNEPIHYLIENAGVMAIPNYSESIDGYEMQFAVNHLGHFYLTILLTPVLLSSSPSRLIVLASSMHSSSPSILNASNNFIENGIRNKNGPSKKDYGWRGWKNYGLSKACNVLFAREYNRRYCKKGICAVSVHPGVINTELKRHSAPAWIYSMGSMFMKTIQQGAATTIRCCSLNDNDIKGGHYYKDCNAANTSLKTEFRPNRGKTAQPKSDKSDKSDKSNDNPINPVNDDDNKVDDKLDDKPKDDTKPDDVQPNDDNVKADDKNKSDDNKPKDDAKPVNNKVNDNDKAQPVQDDKDDDKPPSDDNDNAKVDDKSVDDVKDTGDDNDVIEEEPGMDPLYKKSAEYRLWEWSELLITQKGFKLTIDGFDEEEKQRQIEEKEQNKIQQANDDNKTSDVKDDKSNDNATNDQKQSTDDNKAVDKSDDNPVVDQPNNDDNAKSDDKAIDDDNVPDDNQPKDDKPKDDNQLKDGPKKG